MFPILPIVTFAKNNWKLIAAAVVVGAIAWYHHSLTSEIADQKEKIVSLETANTVLKENNDKLEGVIEANNASIKLLAEGAQQTKKDFATLNSNVNKSAKDLEKRLTGILNEAKPQTCEATIQYLLDAVKGYPK